MRPGQAVAERLGLPVRDLDLLEQALVHSSWLHEHPDAPAALRRIVIEQLDDLERALRAQAAAP